MSRNIFSWSLPPGCSSSDIPGNRPEDEAYEILIENFFESLSEEECETANSNLEFDDIIIKAIDYGINSEIKDQKRIREENKYYEEQFNRCRRGE